MWQGPFGGVKQSGNGREGSKYGLDDYIIDAMDDWRVPGLAIAIVTLPFDFEGKIRMKQAQEGMDELKSSVDTVISIPNDRMVSCGVGPVD